MTTRKTSKKDSADGVVNLNVHRADSLARENRALRRRLTEWLKNARHSDRILSATHKVARMLIESPPNSDWRISAERILKTRLGVAICRIIFFDDAPRESFDAIRKLKKPRRAAALLSGIDFPNAKNMRDFLHLPIIRKGPDNRRDNFPPTKPPTPLIPPPMTTRFASPNCWPSRLAAKSRALKK